MLPRCETKTKNSRFTPDTDELGSASYNTFEVASAPSATPSAWYAISL